MNPDDSLCKYSLGLAAQFTNDFQKTLNKRFALFPFPCGFSSDTKGKERVPNTFLSPLTHLVPIYELILLPTGLRISRVLRGEGV